MGQIAWESPEVRSIRQRWVREGGTKQSLVGLLETIDPVTYAANLRGRQVLEDHAGVHPGRITDLDSEYFTAHHVATPSAV